MDDTIIAASSSTENSTGKRDPEMCETKKDNQWHFGMKAHIGVDTEFGFVNAVVTTLANARDTTQVHELLHGRGADVFADAGYRDVHKREEVRKNHTALNCHIVMMSGRRWALDRSRTCERLVDELERTKARIQAKVEYPFPVLKGQFGFLTVCYRRLVKNTTNLATLFVLANLRGARKRILQGLVG